MNAVEILSHCRNSGIALAVDTEGKLHASGNKDGIATLREDIKAHKAELIAILQAPVTLDLTLAAATAGLPITAEQFRSFLSQDDLADIAAGLIPVECLRAYAERFSKRLPVAVDDDRVCCTDCAHFERMDRPHIGRCAQGHGRHWLWDTDRRECKDFEAAVECQP